MLEPRPQCLHRQPRLRTLYTHKYVFCITRRFWNAGCCWAVNPSFKATSERRGSKGRNSILMIIALISYVGTPLCPVLYKYFPLKMFSKSALSISTMKLNSNHFIPRLRKVFTKYLPVPHFLIHQSFWCRCCCQIPLALIVSLSFFISALNFEWLHYPTEYLSSPQLPY